MRRSSFTIVEVNLQKAESEWPALTDFENAVQSEIEPNAPPITLAALSARWAETPSNYEPFGWIARSGDAASGSGSAIVGYAAMIIDRPLTKPLGIFGLDVLPEFRRKGLGRRLLSHIVERAILEYREMLWATTHDTAPTGELFMQRLGAVKLDENHINQLDILKDLQREILDDWQTQGEQANLEFEILFCDTWLTDDQCSLLAVAEHGIYNSDVAFANLDPAVTQCSIDFIRGENDTTRGIERSVAFVKQRNSKIYAGCTVVRWDKERPDVLDQGSTGILTEFRRRGLGRWLKAAMLTHCLERYPTLRYVRTSNADRNTAILAINTAIGFKPLIGEIRWQVETKQAAKFRKRAC